MLNHIDVLRYLMSTEQDETKHSGYISDVLHLCSNILSLSEVTVSADVYKLVCKMYINAALPSNNLDIIIKSTTECLTKSQYLDEFTQNEHR